MLKRGIFEHSILDIFMRYFYNFAAMPSSLRNASEDGGLPKNSLRISSSSLLPPAARMTSRYSLPVALSMGLALNLV